MSLGDEKKKDLKSVHYNLGFSKIPFSTTHLSSYKPLESPKKGAIDQYFRKTNLKLNNYQNNFENKTIYKTDYVKKEIEE